MADWRYRNHMLETYDDASNSWSPLCEAFGVEKTIVDLLSGKHTVKLFVDSARTGYNTMICDRRFILRKSVMERLFDIGFAQPDDEDDIVVIHKLLLESEQLAPVEYIHDRLGFIKQDDGTEAYLLHQPIGITDAIKATSTFSFSDVTRPSGTFDAWKVLMEEAVLGRPHMELALAIGAVAPVAHVLRRERIIVELPVFAYIGKTSTGKSSAMRLAASMYSLPLEGEGIIENLNATENAFYASLSNVGVPAFCDETTSQNGTFDFAKMIYYLPSGRGKRRCNGDGKVRSLQIFDGCVIFTGETSILEQCKNQNEGLYARIVEFTFDQWTDSSAHAEQLTEGCCKNYATAAPIMIEWILQNQSRIPVIYQKECEALNQLIKGLSNVEHRLIKLYAMILTGAQVIRESLNLDLDVEALRILLRDQLVEGRSDRDKTSDRYRAFLGKIVENGSKFSWATKRSAQHVQTRDAWGVFEYRKSIQAVWIKADIFSELLRQIKVMDIKDVCHEWVQKGWLVDFGCRHYRQEHRINGIAVNAYCVLLPDSADMFSKLSALSSKASDSDILRAIHSGGFDSIVDASTAEAAALQEEAEKTDEKMAIAFIRPFPQGERIVLNQSLATALCLKTSVHATWVADEQKLLLSEAPLSQTAVKVNLKSYKNLKVSTTNKFFLALDKALKFELESGAGIVIFDIDISTVSGHSVAVVDLSGSHPAGCARGTITGWELPHIEYICNDESKSEGNRRFLLGDDEEET